MAFDNVFNLPHNIYEKFEPEPMSGCWLWTACAKPEGYGQVGVNRKTRMAYRVVYELLKGLVPKGLVLDHKCRTPACINPEHLEPVTTAVNIQRGKAAQKPNCARGHPHSGSMYLAKPRQIKGRVASQAL